MILYRTLQSTEITPSLWTVLHVALVSHVVFLFDPHMSINVHSVEFFSLWNPSLHWHILCNTKIMIMVVTRSMLGTFLWFRLIHCIFLENHFRSMFGIFGRHVPIISISDPYDTCLSNTDGFIGLLIWWSHPFIFQITAIN